MGYDRRILLKHLLPYVDQAKDHYLKLYEKKFKGGALSSRIKGLEYFDILKEIYSGQSAKEIAEKRKSHVGNTYQRIYIAQDRLLKYLQIKGIKHE